MKDEALCPHVRTQLHHVSDGFVDASEGREFQKDYFDRNSASKFDKLVFYLNSDMEESLSFFRDPSFGDCVRTS